MRNMRWIVAALVCCMTSFLAVSAQAGRMAGVPVERTLESAQHLVLGEVLSVEERVGKPELVGGDLRFFVVTVRVVESAKGSSEPGGEFVFAYTRPQPGHSSDFGTRFEEGGVYALALRCGGAMIADRDGEEFCASAFFRSPELRESLPEGIETGEVEGAGDEKWLRVSDWRNAGLRFPETFPLHYTDRQDGPVEEGRQGFVAWMRWEALAALVE